MNVRSLKIQDVEKLEEYLYPHKSECMFICSNLKLAGIEYKGNSFEGEYFGFFDAHSKQLLGVIVHYWNGNIMVHASSCAILEQLVRHLRSSISRPVAGVLGPASQAAKVISDLVLPDDDFNINRDEELYEINLSDLNEVVMPSDCSIATAKDVPKDMLRQWMIDYEIETLGATKDDRLLDRVNHRVANLISASSPVLVQTGIPVSLANFNARLEDIVQVGPVWTPLEHRNNGFARLLLAHALYEEKSKGTKKAILFTYNPAAVKAYMAIGFKRIGSYRLAFLRRPIKLY